MDFTQVTQLDMGESVMTLEMLLPWLAGILGVPLTQFFKALLKVEGRSAMWLTVTTSVLLAVGSLAITSGLDGLFDPELVFAAVAKVMTVATILFKAIVSKKA